MLQGASDCFWSVLLESVYPHGSIQQQNLWQQLFYGRHFTVALLKHVLRTPSYLLLKLLPQCESN